MEQEGMWRTVRGHRVFISKDGTIYSNYKALDGKKFTEKNDEKNYKDTDEYQNLSKQLLELDKKDQELHENKPEEEKIDYNKPAKGFTEDEWKEMNKDEKEMFLLMDNNHSKYNEWLKQCIEIDERRSDILAKMKAIQNNAFEKEGGNTFENKLPAKAKPEEYEGFSKDTNTHKDDYLDKEYAKSKGYSEVYIAEMSPKEYMERCGQEIFQVPLEDVYSGIIDKNDIDKYSKMMKEGTKFDMPYLDVKHRQQEGRHRALAAEKLGIKKIPVLYLR